MRRKYSGLGRDSYSGMASPRKTGRLPFSYQEIEYLENSGTQYIDTGVVIGNGFRIAVDIALDASKLPNASRRLAILGVYYGEINNIHSRMYLAGTSANLLYYGVIDKYSGGNISDTTSGTLIQPFSDNVKYPIDFQIKSGNSYFTFDNTLLASSRTVFNFNIGKQLLLFASNSGDTPVISPCTRFYNARIYDKIIY